MSTARQLVFIVCVLFMEKVHGSRRLRQMSQHFFPNNVGGFPGPLREGPLQPGTPTNPLGDLTPCRVKCKLKDPCAGVASGIVSGCLASFQNTTGAVGRAFASLAEGRVFESLSRQTQVVKTAITTLTETTRLTTPDTTAVPEQFITTESNYEKMVSTGSTLTTTKANGDKVVPSPLWWLPF